MCYVYAVVKAFCFFGLHVFVCILALFRPGLMLILSAMSLKWLKQPLTLTLPAQCQASLAAISRACHHLTQTSPCVQEIRTWLSERHLDKTSSNPNGIRVTYEATWSSNAPTPDP